MSAAGTRSESAGDRSASVTPPCPVCTAGTRLLADTTSSFSGQQFSVARCDDCHYSFVTNPRTDFAELYDERYYNGHGADTNVNYEREMDEPSTIRIYEWEGVLKSVSSLASADAQTRWLDFGCGLGGLVRYGRARGFDVVGFDRGYSAGRMLQRGIPYLDSLEADRGTFDVVTAIEVIEHSQDPVAELRTMAEMLRPGGLLFLTTGNAEPFRDDLLAWEYAAPIDVHVGFFEPETLARAMRAAGLEPETPGYLRGSTSIIRHKVLKALGLHRRNIIERVVPWSVASRVVDWRRGVTKQPIARKPQ